MQKEIVISNLFSFSFHNIGKLVPEWLPFWRIGHNHNFLFLYRVNKFYTTGMQVNASIGVGTCKTIFQIATDGTADFGQLGTYLMMTSCLQVDL